MLNATMEAITRRPAPSGASQSSSPEVPVKVEKLENFAQEETKSKVKVERESMEGVLRARLQTPSGASGSTGVQPALDSGTPMKKEAMDSGEEKLHKSGDQIKTEVDEPHFLKVKEEAAPRYAKNIQEPLKLGCMMLFAISLSLSCYEQDSIKIDISGHQWVLNTQFMLQHFAGGHSLGRCMGQGATLSQFLCVSHGFPLAT